jgi:cytochrome bd-type quinol oxidase subunit 2
MKKIVNLAVAFVAVFGIGAAVLAPAPVLAAAADEAREGSCVAAGGTFTAAKGDDPAKCEVPGEGDIWGKDGSANLNNTITQVINTMLFIVGILSVIMIIWGGISFVISRGDPDKTKNARNTIVYAVVGLVVAIIAYALVNWVFNALS